jgi:hypothetical protein
MHVRRLFGTVVVSLEPGASGFYARCASKLRSPSNYGGVCGTVVDGCLSCKVSSGLGGAIPIQN